MASDIHMGRKVIISTNDKDHYLFFAPITAWCWKLMGYEPVTFFLGTGKKVDFVKSWTHGKHHNLNPVKGYKDETVVQVSRLYGGVLYDDYLMTADVDMLPLSYSYFNISEGINVYGADLLQYKQYPICYIGMKGEHWREVMNYQGGLMQAIEHDLKTELKPSEVFEDYWFYDQELITNRMNDWGKSKIRFINRHTDGAYPKGRVDRGDWKPIEQERMIDAHLLRPGYTDENFTRILEVIQTAFPNQDLSDLIEYRNEYLKFL